MSKDGKVLQSNSLSAQKKDMIKLTGIMSFAVIIGKIFSIPSAIITAKVLGPSLFGVLAIINLIIQYAGYTHMGLLQSMHRDVPIAYGKGDKREAKLIKDTVYTGFTILSAFGVLGLWILFISGVTFKGVLDFPVLILISLILIANRIISFLKSYFKAEGKFMIIGRLNLIIKFLTPTLNIPAVILFKLKGVLFAMLLTEAISVGYCMICLKKPKFHFRIKIRKTLQLLKTGSLIFINGISDAIFWSIDLMILTAMMATSYVGLYSMALNAMGVVEPFSQAINMTVYRKIMVDGGKFGVRSKKHFRKYTEGLFASYLLFNSLVLGLGMLIYMVVIKIILIKYIDSIPIIIILGFGYMIYTSRIFLSYYLNITNQLSKRLVIILSALGLNALLDYFLIIKGYGIKGVAFACSFSFLLISVLIIGISFKQIYGTLKSAFSIIFKICSITAILMGIISAFSRWEIINYTSQLSIYSKVLWGTADLIVKGFIFSLVCVGIYFLFFKQYQLYKELKPIVSYVWHSFTNRLKVDKKIVYEGKYE